MSDVKSAKRVLEILRFFAEEQAPASLARVSTALDLPKSSCLALLETLVTEGYAYQTDGRYYLTGRWLREAQAVASHDQVALRCRPTLEKLAQAVGETVILAQLSRDKVVYLDVIEAERVLRFSAHVGQHKPIHAGASGHALLAGLPEEEMQALAASLDYHAFTKSTVTTPKALARRVEEGRKRGWHVNLGEHQADTVSVAAPAMLDGALLALVVGAPMSRLGPEVDKVGAALKRAAAELASLQRQ